MGHSSAVGLLSFALCLVACVSVIAVDGVSETQLPAITKDIAAGAVVAAQNAINEVYDKVKININNATLLLNKVKLFKQQADDAARQAEAAKENKKAQSIIGEIKISSGTVNTFYLSATTELTNANTSMVTLLSEIQTMDDNCKTIMPTEDKAEENYTAENNQALDIKSKANGLETKIAAATTIIIQVQSTAQEMDKNAKKAQVDNLHVSAIVVITELETKIQEADGIIQETQNTRKDIDDIVKKMQELKTTDNIDLSVSFETLINSANGELTKATDVVKKAEKAKSDMTAQKQKANAALSSFATATDVNMAKQSEDATKECVQQVQLIIQSLKSALETTKTSLTSAKGLKEEMVQTLLNAKKKTSTKQGKETTEDNPPVGQGTEPDQKDTTIEPTSTNSPDQSDPSAEKIKDKLSNSAQNVPITALTGGKAPALGAKNDSAMTVSVPLLVTLIASAVLQ